MLQEIVNIKKFLSLENVKNKKFFKAEIEIFLISVEPEPKVSHSYKKKSVL